MIWEVLFDILLLLFTALIFGVICEQLRQSPILGYLAAGTLLGPNALKFISSSTEVTVLAELGVALLLFTIGLEFSWSRVKSLGPSALGGGIAQVIITLGLGALLAACFGLSIPTAIAVGAIFALSSTACVLRLLRSNAMMESIHGRHSLGILLIQDIAVVPLVLLITVLGGDGSLTEVSTEVIKTLILAVVLVGVLYLLFNKVIPRFLKIESLHRNRDLPILLAIVTGLGSAWAAHQFGLSPALGAFVAGMLLAESPFATQIRADVSSIRTLLVTLFFSSIGMVGDPVWLIQNLPAVLSLVITIVFGKALILWAILRFFKLAHANAIATGICLAQAGEFGFVLAAIARGNIIDENLFTLIISATIITLFLTPYLIQYAPKLSTILTQQLSKLGLVSSTLNSNQESMASKKMDVLIIGFGPAGQAIGRTMARLGESVAVIDLSPEMVSIAQQMGLSGHIGDASHADVLSHLNITTAYAIVVSIPDPRAAANIIKLIRSIAPNVYVISRARYHRYSANLEDAGSHVVVDEEQLVGIRLATHLKLRLRSIEKNL